MIFETAAAVSVDHEIVVATHLLSYKRWKKKKKKGLHHNGNKQFKKKNKQTNQKNKNLATGLNSNCSKKLG